MQVRLLGPIDVAADGTARPVAGLRRKAVLAVLGLAAGQIVHTDRLVDRDALRLARQTDSRYVRARALVAVAGAQLALGQLAEAAVAVHEAAELIQHDGYRRPAGAAGALLARIGPTGPASAHLRSRRSTDRAALYPHIPCTPAPGGVAAEHR